MIDYALLLQPKPSLTAHIIDFINRFNRLQTFNQSIYRTLYYKPTGMLVETKVDI